MAFDLASARPVYIDDNTPAAQQARDRARLDLLQGEQRQYGDPQSQAALDTEIAETQSKLLKRGFDLGSARPVYQEPVPAAPTAQKAKPRVTPVESPTSFGNLVGAAVEPLATILSGAVAQPIAGISGLGAGALGALGVTGMNAAAQVEKVQNALTYKPRTQGGKNAMEVIGYLPEKLVELSKAAGQKTVDVTGSPGLATQVETALQFAPAALGVKALKGSAPVTTARTLEPAVQELASRGIRLTPGELLGGGWSRAEQALSSFPVVGSFVKEARNRSLRDFATATVNDAMAPIGATAPKGMTGHDAVAWARNKLSEAYSETLSQAVGRLDAPTTGTPGVPALPGAGVAPSLRADVNGVLNIAKSSKMPRQYVNELNGIVRQEVFDQFAPGGVVSGETIKAMQSNLGSIANTKRRSENFFVRKQAEALDEVRASIKRMMERENPGLAEQLSNIDTAYGKFKIVQKAASSAAADKGVFTPAQFMSAVRAKDFTKDKRATSEGTARSQALAEAGKDVLSPTLNDSGTPTRLLVADLLLGGGGHFFAGPGGAAAALALPAAYSPFGVAAFQKAMTAPRPSGIASKALYGLLNQQEEQNRKR